MRRFEITVAIFDSPACPPGPQIRKAIIPSILKVALHKLVVAKVLAGLLFCPQAVEASTINFTRYLTLQGRSIG